MRTSSNHDGTRGFSVDQLAREQLSLTLQSDALVVFSAKVKLGGNITLLKACTVLRRYTCLGGGARGGVWPTSHLPHCHHLATQYLQFLVLVEALVRVGHEDM